MTSGKYDHKGIKHDKEDLHPEFCRCGKKWGRHSLEFEIRMKPNCVACNLPINVQCEERYYDKGNYCDKCNNLAGKHTHSSDLSFEELFKNKLK